MPAWLIPAFKGLAFGTAVSVLKHLLLVRGIKEAARMPGAKARNAVMLSFLIRFVLNLAAMLLVYKNTPLLIGTALGLTMSRIFLIFSRKI